MELRESRDGTRETGQVWGVGVGEAQTKLGRELTKNTLSKVSSREQLNLRIPSLEVTASCAHQALEEACEKG